MLKLRQLFFLKILLGLLLLSSNNYAQESQEVDQMEKVTGMGGWFIRSVDPAALSLWYETHLGINRTPESYEAEVWEQEQGPTVFAPFPDDTEYFGREGQAWMINFRVNDLDAMVRQLEQAGIEITVDEQEYPNGRFARLYDPEGNPIELWEPKSTD